MSGDANPRGGMVDPDAEVWPDLPIPLKHVDVAKREMREALAQQHADALRQAQMEEQLARIIVGYGEKCEEFLRHKQEAAEGRNENLRGYWELMAIDCSRTAFRASAELQYRRGQILASHGSPQRR